MLLRRHASLALATVFLLSIASAVLAQSTFGTLGRNTIEGPSYTTVDVRVAREFPLGNRVRGELSVDAFNLFNRENVKDLNTNFGSDNPNATPNPLLGYLTPRALFNPFQMQIGLRVRF